MERWKTHHRLHQLKEIHQESLVRLAWLVWTEEDLSTAEKYFINLYQPLLNGTKVKIPKTIPSEIILIELLEQIRLLTVIIGIHPATNNKLTTVYLKYDYENSGDNGCARTIKKFKKENKDRGSNLRIKRSKYGEYRTHNLRPGSREHKVISRIKSSYNNHWEIACNGVIIDITPTNKDNIKLLRNSENSNWRKLAGIKLRTVNNFQGFEYLDFYDSFKREHPNLSIMVDDPIPLLWIRK
jgi:DNA-directed RNA polymerase subunit F